jgi:hypothetical protein
LNGINYSEKAASNRLTSSNLATKPLVLWCIALIYASIFSQISNTNFIDFQSYLNYAESSWILIFKYADNGLLALLFNEPVWLLINSILSYLFQPDTVVRLIVFFSAFSFAWLIIKNNPEDFFWLLIFLLLPAVIKNYLIHLRQGLGIAFFLWGWFSVSRTARWALFGIAAMVHASFFFIILLLFLSKLFAIARFGFGLRNLGNIFISVVISIALGSLVEAIGARQAESYNFEKTDGSGLGFLFWAIILFVLIIQGRSYQRKHTFPIAILGFYLISYWFIEVSARIFESGLILVLLAGLELTGWRRTAFRTLIFAFSGLNWLLKIAEPGLGFTKS